MKILVAVFFVATIVFISTLAYGYRNFSEALAPQILRRKGDRDSGVLMPVLLFMFLGTDDELEGALKKAGFGPRVRKWRIFSIAAFTIFLVSFGITFFMGLDQISKTPPRCNDLPGTSGSKTECK